MEYTRPSPLPPLVCVRRGNDTNESNVQETMARNGQVHHALRIILKQNPCFLEYSRQTDFFPVLRTH